MKIGQNVRQLAHYFHTSAHMVHLISMNINEVLFLSVDPIVYEIKCLYSLIPGSMRMRLYIINAVLFLGA